MSQVFLQVQLICFRLVNRALFGAKAVQMVMCYGEKSVEGLFYIIAFTIANSLKQVFK